MVQFKKGEILSLQENDHDKRNCGHKRLGGHFTESDVRKIATFRGRCDRRIKLVNFA